MNYNIKQKLKNIMQKKISYYYSYKYFHTPTGNQLNNKLYELHTQNFQCNEKDFLDLFKHNNINFYVLQNLIKDYISYCPKYVQTVKIVHKKELILVITVEGPNVRYEFDLTYLNDDLMKAYDAKYILSVIDVFTWKAIIYKHNSKKSENILIIYLNIV